MNKIRRIIVVLVFAVIFSACSNSENDYGGAFIERLRPAPVDGGFQMDKYWVWGGSPIKGDDGKYHLFASRWPKKYPFFEGYVFYSEIVHALSNNPEGPYEFSDIAIKTRGEEYWDGRMAHNPSIIKYGDTYYLYYIGSTYEGISPSADSLERQKRIYRQPAYKNIRIGVARSNSLNGPWERSDKPILSPQQDGWDSVVVTNPAPCLTQKGEVYLVYRTYIRGVGHRLGITRAIHPDSAYKRIVNGPIAAEQVEDPFIWQENNIFYIIAKDMTGDITGEKHASVFLSSKDLMEWQLMNPPKAYSRTVVWGNGDTTVQGSLERPQLLFEEGKPTHLFCATADGPGGFRKASKTWNMVIPLKE